LLYFVQFRCLTSHHYYRDKKVVGVFVRFLRRFTSQKFRKHLDYNFTAKVEQDFDEILSDQLVSNDARNASFIQT
jgi:hypothetical protein